MSDPAAGPPIQFPPPRNPDDLGRGPMIMGLTWTLTTFALAASTLRLYVRRQKLQIDDWLMFAAGTLQLFAQILATVSFSYGLGKHDLDLRMPDELIEVIKWNWAHTAPGMVVSILARISITILLIRLFGVHNWFKWFLIVLTAIQVAAGTAILICSWIQVRPIEGLWNIFMLDVDRWDPRILLYLMYFGQSTYTFADLTYVVIPIAIIWRLNMSLERRIGLVLVMGVSLVTVFFSIMKTITATSGGSDSDEPLYEAAMTVLWANGEQACVVLLGCVPPLRSAASQSGFTPFRSVGHSLASLLGTRGGRTKGSSSGKHSSLKRTGNSTASGAYVDIDMTNNTHKLGHIGADSRYDVDIEAPTGAYGDTESSKSLVAGGQVRRTHAFTIEYEQDPRHAHHGQMQQR